MKLSRGLGIALLVLLALHGLLWAWGQGVLGGNPGSTQREPGRLDLQQQPERFQLLGPEAASAAMRPLQCREIGVFTDDAQLLAAEQAISSLLKLPPSSWQRVERTTPGVWLLATGRNRDPIRVRTQLERAGLSDFRPQALLGEPDASWVLGRFDSEEAAQAEQRRLARDKGLVALRVVTQRLPGQQRWLRLPALEDRMLKADHPAWPGGLRPCQAGPSARAADQAAVRPS